MDYQKTSCLSLSHTFSPSIFPIFNIFLFLSLILHSFYQSLLLYISLSTWISHFGIGYSSTYLALSVTNLYLSILFKVVISSLHFNCSLPGSSLEEGDEDSYLRNRQTNLVMSFMDSLYLLFRHFIKQQPTTLCFISHYLLGSPAVFCAFISW